MRSRPYSLLQKLAALVPGILLLLCAPGQAYLRCRIDGSVRSACCCPAEKEAEDGPDSSVPVLHAQDCCDRQVTIAVRPVVDAPRSATPDIVPAAFVLLPVALSLLSPPTSRPERAWPSHGPPRGGPAVILLKQSFLI